jgi:hypothetical protein
VPCADGPLAAAPKEREAVPTTIVFSGEVTDLVKLAGYSGEALPVHFDPRFALSVKIEQAKPADPAIAPKQVTVFAIHSPARLFGGVGLLEAAQIIGQRFELSVDKRAEPEGPRWGALAVRKHLPRQPSAIWRESGRDAVFRSR